MVAFFCCWIPLEFFAFLGTRAVDGPLLALPTTKSCVYVRAKSALDYENKSEPNKEDYAGNIKTLPTLIKEKKPQLLTRISQRSEIYPVVTMLLRPPQSPVRCKMHGFTLEDQDLPESSTHPVNDQMVKNSRARHSAFFLPSACIWHWPTLCC